MNELFEFEEFIEPERYELFETRAGGPVGPSEASSIASQSWTKRDAADAITRRELMTLLGAGLLVYCLAPEADAQESGRGRRGGFGGQGPRDIGAWLHIGEDGKVTVFTGKAEVGQNARTSLGQAVAEELRVPMSAIRVVMGDTELTPYDAGTFGSQTTPRMAPQLHRAAAAARETLIGLAADDWKVDRTALVASDGKIVHKASNRSATYGQLTKGQKLTQTIGADAPVTPASEWKIAGKSARKLNAEDIVTGRHHYSSDIKRPGMVYGKVIRPPSYGAKLANADLNPASSISGAAAFRDGEFIGVVAPDVHAAAKAAEAVKTQWTEVPHASSKELFEILKKESGREGGGRGFGGGGGNNSGSIEAGLSQSDVKLRETYTVAYIAHAPLEPRAAVAEWNGDRLTVWTGTQRPFGVRSELASEFKMPEEKVHVIVPDTGSGYGGKHTGEAALEAARLSKAAGKPVKLIWTREEEFTWAYFRPAGVIEVASGAAKDGKLLAWEFHNYNSGGSAIGSPYGAPNQRIQFHGSQSPLRQGSYRALASTANNFARETHMDELARSLKMDPVEFRLKNLKDTRLRAVLTAAAEQFGWGKSKPASNRGFGIACGTEKGGYVATCAEVECAPVRTAYRSPGAGSRGGAGVRIVRAVTAFECGAIVNPEHLKNQVEGAVMMGIGGAMFEAIQFENGRIVNPRFSKYRIPRFGDAPAFDTILLDRKDLPSAGAGESPIICIAPAIGNAIFDASGVRHRSMPMV